MPLHRLALLALFLSLFLGGKVSQAQQLLNLEVVSIDNSDQILRSYKYTRRVADSLSGISVGQNLVSGLHREGFLLAELNKAQLENSEMKLYILVGPQFEWINLRAGNLDAELWRRLNFKQSNFSSKPFRITEIEKLEANVLKFAERNGYPFASIKFDSLQIEGDGFSAALNVDFGPPITFDSVQVVQSNVLKSKFAEAYLGIELGKTYDQRLVDAIVPKLRKLPYLRLSKSPLLTFQNSEGRVVLEVEKRKVNTIDGIIGLLPNSGRESGLLLTGQFDLELYNPFASGKHIGIHWRRLHEETQTLALEYDHPNLFGSSLSLQSDFNFLKQDSTFNRRILGFDLNLNLGASSNLGLITKFTATDLIATSQYQGSNELPDILDFRLTRYGLRYSFNNLDDVILPKSGLLFELAGSVGNKTIRPNAELPNELYAQVDMQTLQYQYDLGFDYYFPLSSKTTMYTSLHGGLLSSDNLFQNDAYRIGGLRSIRGFDEASYFATTFVYSNLESRFYLDETSYLLLFTDLGYVEERFVRQENKRADLALGLGTGISFATNTGIFNFVYALGTSNSTGAINFNQSKIHFGFTTRF
ncbi:MAG: BamA/TamA family outer membrane protein [Roseivirga sp.]|uniref:ShlB/FhaC/HecB family hemolysin secretion/activation protein n=1 Tax=Roseivirga sp. TaxID=1964215 RepID=UPI001AFDA2AC|nr:ShlB/FhaC/HecB family hemolysin secretion/activation protein [Roseivirga sp.]MBO6661093.1 BamA/TamA family outer membrane protein [Roseivirga sp.]MBO6908923.1 BamA/TamA family outer membrane protein [Roseivirga sp.]